AFAAAFPQPGRLRFWRRLRTRHVLRIRFRTRPDSHVPLCGIPHAGDWQQAAVYRDGQAFNPPFLIHKAQLHTGTLPARWGLLQISPSNVVLTAVRPGPGQTTIIRVYEASGRNTPGVKIALHARVTAANE